jgi:hypothetical protein
VWWWVGGGVAVVLAVAAALLFQPWLLFVDVRVDDEIPSAVTTPARVSSPSRTSRRRTAPTCTSG